ncbi:tRNA lysidine(34) synthetase TilS [Persicobacter sp. CCB-QB2]|uniref:tRNA lysidine(34) synthetase TilS n=1 Tax=Persicobacter sp. CCB-QB2 TaxID=1561025 RepID=UPI0006A9E98E|nr:tRNA lysidine(34) synthetase TilS [Persicobacter sp. CCB-QB2]
MKLKAFLAHIHNHFPHLTTTKSLLAVSGGMDSMVLATLCLKAKIPFILAHCNFQLRGSSSDLDELLVRKWAEEHQVPLYCRSFHTMAEAKERGQSIEMVARQLRYEWFEELMKSQNCDQLLTAHHLNDQLETFLFNMAKGCGIRGLKGMPEQHDRLARPLLQFSRKDILAYAKMEGIPFREDESNQDTQYHRNKIRQNIIPELKKINPELEHTFRNSQARIAAADRQLQHWVNSHLENHGDWKQQLFYLPTSRVFSQKEPTLYLELWLREYGFNYQQVLQIAEGHGENSGSLFESGDFALQVDRGNFILGQKPQAPPAQIIENSRQTLNLHQFQWQSDTFNVKDFQLEKNPLIGAFDLDLLQFPLKLRPWKLGDKFRPLGMKGKKKVSDFLIDQKIPILLKAQTMVLESQGEIVWLVGYRPDDRFKIGPKTKNIWRIELKQNEITF